MNQDLPPPPRELRPWYYQNLFLVAAFVLWPAWSLLIIRSPWHNGILSGGVAWATLIVGSVAIFKTAQVDRWDLIVLIVPPGLALTFALQVFWESYKKQYLAPYLPVITPAVTNEASQKTEASSGQDYAPSPPGSTPRERQRRRSRSRRPPRR